MSLLTREERMRLINLILRIPGAGDPQWRGSLLATLPANLRLAIPDLPDAHTHITSMIDIVDGDAWAVLPDGTLSVTVLMENARVAVEGSQIGDELRVLLDVIRLRRPVGQGAFQPSVALAALISDPATLSIESAVLELRELLNAIQERLQQALATLDKLQKQPISNK